MRPVGVPSPRFPEPRSVPLGFTVHRGTSCFITGMACLCRRPLYVRLETSGRIGRPATLKVGAVRRHQVGCTVTASSFSTLMSIRRFPCS